MSYLFENLPSDAEYPWWIEPRHLIYDQGLSRFPPNTLISVILKNLMIESWNSSALYDRFYDSCAPSYCTYSKRTRTETVNSIILMLLSVIGGLTVVLRLITPHLVKCIIRLWELLTKKQQRQQQQQGNHYSNICTKSIASLVFIRLDRR